MCTLFSLIPANSFRSPLLFGTLKHGQFEYHDYEKERMGRSGKSSINIQTSTYIGLLLTSTMNYRG